MSFPQSFPPVSFTTPIQTNHNAAEVEITVELLDAPITIKIRLSDTVSQLKDKIRAEIKADQEERITLIFDGKKMDYEEQTLESYNITKDSLIYQGDESSQKGGNKSVPFGIEFNELKTKKMLQLTNKGPDYQTITAGLNFRGTCVTKDCVAFGKVVWIQKGMGTFNVCEEVYLSVCPKCKKTADNIYNLGFFNCYYSIKGLQVKPEKKMVDEKDIIADNKEFTTFMESKEHAHWATLSVTTRKK